MSLNNAYETKLNKGFKVSGTLQEIAMAKLSDALHSTQDGVVYVTENANVSPFVYPILDKESGVVYVDARPFSSVDRSGGLNIKNSADNTLASVQARLELVWSKSEKMDSTFNTMNFASEVFVRWLTNLISHRYGLGPLQRNQVTAVCALFNIGRYYNNVGNEVTQARYLQQIKQKFPVDIDTVTSVFESIDKIFPRDVDEFVEAISKMGLGPRLHGFNTTALYSLLGGSWWITSNPQQVVAIALEYPPAFASLVYLAASNNMFKKTTIGEVVYDMQKNDSSKHYLRAMDLLMEQYT